jgi:antitoxin (DNA-binding transcriptional repressor) of toxin-antitoxin stability system
MNASTFKAQCLALFDEIAATGESLQIVKRGKPVAVVSAPAPLEYPQLQLRGRGRVIGNLVAPPLPVDAWEADLTSLRDEGRAGSLRDEGRAGKKTPRKR